MQYHLHVNKPIKTDCISGGLDFAGHGMPKLRKRRRVIAFDHKHGGHEDRSGHMGARSKQPLEKD